MNRAFFPFRFLPTQAVLSCFGPLTRDVAVLALRTLIKNRKSLEVAHQQIAFRGHHVALSSRITASGELLIELDLGDPRLAHHVVLEDDLRRAGQAARTGRDYDRQRTRR